jgi:hypothetical protein
VTDKVKKILLGLAALTALALGGSALAGAASGGKDTATQQRSGVAERNESENGNEDAGEDDGESDRAVTGQDASRAREAAAAETGGRPGDVERDSEHGATYEVEVTKAGGETADVRLDDRFKVVAVDEDGDGHETGDDADTGEQTDDAEQGAATP